jgi:hypothetical protein
MGDTGERAGGPAAGTGSGGGLPGGESAGAPGGAPGQVPGRAHGVDWTGRPAWFIVNDSAAFLVELAAFAALCWWGLRAGGPVLAVVTTLAAMVVWGLFAAPRARFAVPLAVVLAVKALVLGGGAVALWPAGHPVWAIVLGAVVVVNTGLAQVARRRPARPEA